MHNSFTGRKPIFDLIKKRVFDLKEGYRQNLCFLGSQYVGKTTIVQKFLYDLDDPAIAAVYLDLENRDLDYMVLKTTRSLLYQFLKYRQHKNLSEDVTVLMNMTQEFLPQTISLVHELLSLRGKSNQEMLFDRLLTLPDVFYRETGMFCVFIYDEFHQMDVFDIQDVFKKLAQHIMQQKQCLYILMSSFQEKACKILDEKLTLLFGNFEMVEINPLDLKGSHELMTYRLSGIRMGIQLKNFLADFTGGCPLYLDLLTSEVVNLAAIYKQDEIYVPLLVQSIENLIFSRWGALSRHFELITSRLCVGKTNRLTMELLFLLANGQHKIEEFLKMLGCSRTILNARLTFLMDEDIIEKNGTIFYLKDKLFRYWLKYVFQRRLKSLDVDPVRGRREFKDEATKAIVDFQSLVRQDLSSRLLEALKVFENDQIDLYGKKYKIPVFQDIKILKMKHHGGLSSDVVVVGTDEGSWLLVFRKDLVVEQDINAIVEESKKMGLHPKRCVMVSLSDLDEHARVKALQERMWIWNERELNTLMYLTDKPCVML